MKDLTHIPKFMDIWFAKRSSFYKCEFVNEVLEFVFVFRLLKSGIRSEYNEPMEIEQQTAQSVCWEIRHE